jgi:protein involved in polysaccharide export with SLBB domain
MKSKLLCLLLVLVAFGAWAIVIPLANVPQISVSITGYVRHPGQYKMYSTDRISDLLDRAMLDDAMLARSAVPGALNDAAVKKTNPIPQLREAEESQPEYEKLQALRHVELVRAGNRSTYDLLRFYRLGELEANPMIKDGDLVFIPVIKEQSGVSGAVGLPGDIEYKEGDSLKDVIALAGGTLPGAELSAIRISRYNGSGKPSSYETVDISRAASILIKPGDRISVPQDSRYREQRVVTLSGEFVLQGEFMVDKDATLWDVIQMAGGLTEKADVANALVLNRRFNEEPDAEFERLKARGMQEITPLEYAYLKSYVRQAKGLYSVDFAKLMASEGREGNRPVNNQDHIYVPEKLTAVWVMGQVRHPGLIEYRDGQNWKYYLQESGGYANNRLRGGIRIMKAQSSIWEKADSDYALMPGDIVFIPDKADRHIWTDVRDVFAVVASAVTILIGVQNLTK